MPWHETSHRVHRNTPFLGVRFTLVLAAYLAVNAMASVEADPVSVAESQFLALLVGGVLACIAILAPHPSWELSSTALLATTAVWIVGYGPHRGALVTSVLLVGLVVSVARIDRLDGVLKSTARTVATALGFQLLVRGDLLLLPVLDPRTLVSVLVLPWFSGLALWILARYFTSSMVALAGLAVFVLSPGWNVTTTLALGCLAAGQLMADRDLPFWARVAAAATLVVPLLWNGPLGLLFVLGALTFQVEGRTSWLLSMAGITVLVWRPPVRLGTELLTFWSQLLVLVPALVRAPGSGRHLVLRGGFLALVAAMLGGGPEVLAGGLALAVLGLGKPETDDIDQMQHSWMVFLALGTTLLASYPWIRTDPLRGFLELLGLDSVQPTLLVAFGLVLGLGGVLELWRRYGSAPRPSVVFALLAFLGLARGVPSQVVVPISFESIDLTADRPVWTHRFPPSTVTGGILDSHLVHGAGLELGTWVATVRLRGTDQELLGSWQILAGFDTAEWAAARQDVAGRPGFRAPEPWLSQVTAGRTFFSQRFRARFYGEEGLDAETVIVRRNPNLPPDVVLTLYRLELRR